MTAIGRDSVGSVYTAEDYSTTEPELENDKFSDDEYEPPLSIARNASHDLDVEKKSSPPPDLIRTSKYIDIEVEGEPESPRQLVVAWESDIEPNSKQEKKDPDPSLLPWQVKALFGMRIEEQEITPPWRTNDKPPKSQRRSKKKNPQQYESDLSPDSPTNVFLRFGSRDSF